VTEWWRMDIVGSNEATPLAGHAVANNETDLLKVGFVFFKEGDAYENESGAIDPWAKDGKAIKKQ
jgi:hypothetical protein